jgi:hypothetical protein
MINKKLLILSLGLIMTAQMIFAQSWLNRPNFPNSSRTAVGSFAIGSKGYYIGGETPSSGNLVDTWEYDTNNNTWNQKANYPGIGTQKGVAFSINGVGYYGLGTTGGQLYSYNSQNNLWTQKMTCNLTSVSFWSTTYFVVGTKAYFLDNNSKFFYYDSVSDSWTLLPDFNGTKRSTGVGFSINDKGYICSGLNSTSAGNTMLNDLWEYNTTTNAWSQKTSLPSTGRYASFGFSFNNKGYVLGGETNTTVMSNQFWEYNHVSDTWYSLPNYIGGAKNYLTGFVANNSVYAGFGSPGYGVNFNEYGFYNLCSTSAPIGNASQTLCSGSTITDLTATGTNIQWYSVSTGGTALSSTSALVSGTTYYASQTISGCESATRLAVIVILNNPTVSATATTICGGSSVSLTASDVNNSQQIDNKTAQFSNNVSNSIGLNYASQSPTINFSYDFWFNTSRTITLLSEKTGGVSVQAVNGQNFVVFPTQPRGSGISVGTNGISVIEHSPNFLDSRFTLQTNLSGWHHCAVVYSNNNFSIYIDGVLSGSRINGTNFGGFGNTYTNVTLTQSIGDGYPGFDANDNYTGKLDEYRQWSVALTSSQISQIYRRKLQSINMVECNLNLTFDQNTAVNNSNISSGLTLSNTSLPTFTSDNTFQIGGFTGTTVTNITNTNFNGTSSSSYLWSTGETSHTITVIPAQTTQYWVDVTTNGITCRKFITITVNSTTSTPTGSTLQTLCSGSTVANLTATGINIQWYSASTGGTALASTTALVNGTTYYASQTVSGCESTARLAVIVSLNNPTVSASSTTICGGTNVTITALTGTLTTSNFSVGSIGPSGGYVFYDQGSVINGWRYLEAMPYDVINTNNFSLGCYCNTISNTSNIIGSGYTNTIAWANSGCPTIANNYNPSGNTDWFIPSKDELNLMFTNLKINNLGNFQNLQYWSSTPAAYGSCGINGGAWVQNFTSGTQNSEYRNGYQGSGNLRLVRKFTSGYNYLTYLWSTGETTQSINPTPNQTTQYWVDVTTNGVTCRKYITINVDTNIAPSINVTTQSSCANPSGTVQINFPISGGITPQNLFISEVTDTSANSLNYIELFNKTGNTIDLSNYKIKVYNNGGTNPSCVSLLTGLIANNSTFVIKLSAEANQNGIVPNFTLTSCGGVDMDDNIRLTTVNDVEIDIWGRTDGIAFTPNNQAGYTYRRHSNAILPSTTWSPVDWDEIDPEDYSDIGNYVFPTNNVYNYSVDGGSYQTSTIFNGLTVGNHTITVKDMNTGCTSSTTFTIQSASVLPTGDIAQTFCIGATVSNLVANGTTIKWYLSSSGGTTLSSTTTLLNNTSYFATQTINGCESQTRLEVKVTIVDIQINTPNSNVCPGGSTTLTSTDLNNISSTNCLNASSQLQIGLQAFYPFCGNANDISESSLNGTVVGATLTSDRFGNLNSAYSFGQNQQINIPNTSGKNTYPLTISLWYNPSALTTGQNGNLFSKYTVASWNGFGLGFFDHTFAGQGIAAAPFYLRDTSNRVIGLYNEPAFNQSNVHFNTWYNVVFTLDANGGKIYLNGQLIDTHNWTGTAGPSNCGDLWKIGGKWDYWFNGKIDDVAIWNRVLSPIEVQEIYNTPMTTSSSTYLWSTGETAPTISVSPTQTTQYSVAVTTNGVTCIKYITITVGSATTAPLGANNQTMTQGSTLANLVVTGQNIVWYSTPFGGTPLPTNTLLVNGVTYYASQTINGCESQYRLPVIVQITLSNEEFDTINIVYNPNPVIDILNIKSSTELKNAKICNLLGQTIFQQKYNSNEIQLNMSDVSSGTYFVIVESDDRKETFKVLKK